MSERDHASSVDGDAIRLPQGWIWCRMHDVADVVGGSTPKSKEPSYWGGDLPWLAVSDLTGYEEKYISRGARTITKAGYDSCPTQLMPRGSVLYSSRAPIGYVAIAANEVCTSQGFKSFIPRDGVSSEYLYWYLKSIKHVAESRASGTTFREISGRAAGHLPLALAPRPEQDRIVEAIEQQMALIEETEQALETADVKEEQLRRSILHAAFTGELVPQDGRNAHAVRENAERGLPEGWEHKPLGEVAECKLGKMLDKAKNRGSLRPYLRNVNVQWGAIEISDLKKMAITDAEVERYSVRKGDLLVCEGGEPGRCAIWERDDVIGFQKALHRVRTSERLSAKFLANYLRHFTRTDEIALFLTGTTIKHLPGEKLAQVPVPLPPRHEQDRIVEAIELQKATLDSLRSAREAVRVALERVRRSLLHAAFTGELVQQDPADEPADRLLERIRAQRDVRMDTRRVEPDPVKRRRRSRGRSKG